MRAPTLRPARPHLASWAAAALLALLTLATPELLPAQPPPGSRADLVALMGLLAQRRHGHVAYQEEHVLAALDRPLLSEGELIYDAPGHLEKRTLRPKPETLVLDGGIITARRGGHTHVLRLEEYPQIVPLIDSIRATLAGDLPALERVFNVGWQGNIDQWRLQLVPREAEMSQSVKQIEIRGARDRIQSVEIDQGDGDRSVLTVGPELP
jgi:hypothetical protein